MRLRAHKFMSFLLLVTSLGVGGVMAQSDACDVGLDFVAEAAAAVAQDDFAAALQAYGCALANDPADKTIRMDRLEAALRAGDYVLAYSDIFLLNNTSPESVIARLDDLSTGDPLPQRAFLAIFSPVPNYELALADAETLLMNEPDGAFALVIRSAAYEGLGDVDQAHDAFEQAVVLSPENAQIYGLMAAAQFSIFNIEGIRQNASHAINLDPNIAQLYRLRGFTSMVMGDIEAVLADANRAIERDPDYFAFYILRGNAYRASGDLEAASADFDQVITLVPQSSFGYALRAELQMQMGQQADAATDLATAIELDTLERVDGDALLADEEMVVTMSFGHTFYLPFDAQKGDLLNLTATSVDPGVVDPVILLVGPDGTPLIFNDDADPAAEIWDSIIANFEAPANGTYTLVIGHAAGGSEGDISVLLDVH